VALLVPHPSGKSAATMTQPRIRMGLVYRSCQASMPDFGMPPLNLRMNGYLRSGSSP
jgi:hypothetical protein